MTVTSPLTGSPDVSLDRELNVPTIIRRYQDEIGIDVSRFFAGLQTVPVYRCNASGLRFYYPFSLAGDGGFYADLSTHYGGYYNPWKWEHEQVFPLVKPGDRVLEIGCGNGYFLKKIKEKGATGLGLELNDEAIRAGQKLGVEIRNEPLADHARTHAGQYDLVCAFQVFEHVDEVGKFFRQAVACVRPGGRLAIGVPNNDSYYFREDPYHTLNLPPHHMLLWNPDSLRHAGQMLGLTVEAMRVEPSRTVHRSLSYKLWLQNRLGSSVFSSLLYKTTRFVAKRLPIFPDGATVVAVYRN